MVTIPRHCLMGFKPACGVAADLSRPNFAYLRIVRANSQRSADALVRVSSRKLSCAARTRASALLPLVPEVAVSSLDEANRGALVANFLPCGLRRTTLRCHAAPRPLFIARTA